MRDNNTTRKMAIILAAILGMLVLLYLGGLFGQLNDNYQGWLAQGGMDGDAVIRAPDFNPLACVPYSFNPSGIKSLGLVSLTAAVLFAYIKFHGKFGKGEYDDRNFKRAREGTYGTAAWMSDREMKKVLEVTAPSEAKGVILGEKSGRDNHTGTMLYVCSRYPVCDAYIRVIPGTKTPVGSMANGDLRALRNKAHQHFDRLHLTGIMSRDQAYEWLACIVQAPLSRAHIGHLGEYYCRQVIAESKRLLENRRKVHGLPSGPLRKVIGGENYAVK